MAMSSKLGLTIAVGALALACSACAPVDPGFGESVKYAQAVQTIDPDPVYGPDSAQPGDNGDKGSQAVKRYRTGNVKNVETMSTSTGSSGGGGGPQ
jgi:hypothetical protein